MVKAKFEIGENEMHTIFVNAIPFLKYIRIEFNGERVIDVPNFQPSRKFEIEAGKEERHNVEIAMRALTPVKLFVD